MACVRCAQRVSEDRSSSRRAVECMARVRQRSTAGRTAVGRAGCSRSTEARRNAPGRDFGNSAVPQPVTAISQRRNEKWKKTTHKHSREQRENATGCTIWCLFEQLHVVRHPSPQCSTSFLCLSLSGRSSAGVPHPLSTALLFSPTVCTQGRAHLSVRKLARCWRPVGELDHWCSHVAERCRGKERSEAAG